mmetsp:Transcript_44239/g.143520  ORF Transcript_44239/g.143520 Transcript_44239/m.143520 type:complete len:231 (-) Transcript_44239:159-851(-)
MRHHRRHARLCRLHRHRRHAFLGRGTALPAAAGSVSIWWHAARHVGRGGERTDRRTDGRGGSGRWSPGAAARRWPLQPGRGAGAGDASGHRVGGARARLRAEGVSCRARLRDRVRQGGPRANRAPAAPLVASRSASLVASLAAGARVEPLALARTNWGGDLPAVDAVEQPLLDKPREPRAAIRPPAHANLWCRGAAQDASSRALREAGRRGTPRPGGSRRVVLGLTEGPR